MTTHLHELRYDDEAKQRNKFPLICRASTAAGIASVVLMCACAASFAQVRRWTMPAPELQRVIVSEDKAYWINYQEPRARGGAGLVILDFGDKSQKEATTVFVIGSNFGIDAVTGMKFLPREDDAAQKLIHRWGIIGQELLLAPSARFGGGTMLSLKLDELRPVTENERMHLENVVYAMPSDPTKDEFGRTPIEVSFIEGTMMRVGQIGEVELTPIQEYAAGAIGWNVGDMVRRPGLRTQVRPVDLHYDLHPIVEGRLDLYVTVDGDLYRWLFDKTIGSGKQWSFGDAWQLEAKYDFKLQGPFLFLGTIGKGVVAERDGQWSVIGPLDAEEPDARVIVARDQELPLNLVEDVHAKKDYFRQGKRLFDDRGRFIAAINTLAGHDDQLREVVSKVVARRK